MFCLNTTKFLIFMFLLVFLFDYTYKGFLYGVLEQLLIIKKVLIANTYNVIFKFKYIFNVVIYKLIGWRIIQEAYNRRIPIAVKIVTLVVIILSLKYVLRTHFDLTLFNISYAETEETKEIKSYDSGIVKWWQLAIVMSLITGILGVVVYQLLMLITSVEQLSSSLFENLAAESNKINMQIDNFNYANFIKTENIVKRVTENLSDTMAQNISEKISQNVYEDINDLTNRMSNLENKFDAIIELAKRLKK